MFRKELVIDNKIEEVERLYPFVMDLSNHFSIAAPLANSINLALEEALVNAVEYAYNGKSGKITLSAEYVPATETVVFVLSDTGVAFNPLEYPDADTSLPLHEREIGGLGIFLIKEIMDKVEYCRKGDMNILTMYKSFPDKNRDLSGSGVQ